MRFAQAGIAAADVGGEVMPEFEFVELAVNAIAVAAGDQTQGVDASKLPRGRDVRRAKVLGDVWRSVGARSDRRASYLARGRLAAR